MAYDEAARARRVPEPDRRTGRSAFQRDRARVLHSGALRRLAGKTQVVEPLGVQALVPRTRLTHSLECSQVGRELGASLGCDPDLVDTACLAHDLGHPPFGHNGELALDEAAQACGGFEGNAQSFRLLTRLEVKVEGVGLNLTRATLDAATKYPWSRSEGRPKFGVYDDDVEAFRWARAGVEGEARPLESQVMDWSDDVAYSVHDVEDGIVGGLIDTAALDVMQVAEIAAEHYSTAGVFDLEQVARGLVAQDWWPGSYDGSGAAQIAVKRMTSLLIGRFCSAAERATRAQFGDHELHGYAADLVVPFVERAEVAVLKAMTRLYVMQRPEAADIQAREREVLRELVPLVVDRVALDPFYEELWDSAADDAARLRVAVDQVAALTDAAALRLHTRLTG
ncbi:MAG: deoxyguanosinetriphosphate triphosphohydrolase [Frankiales bacterium]|nr:deoxyguanosinetriphosphate triphosphohydrolase [Frankiales bacterium]